MCCVMLHCAARKVSQAVSASRYDRRQVSHAVKVCRQHCDSFLSGKWLGVHADPCSPNKQQPGGHECYSSRPGDECHADVGGGVSMQG